MATIRKITSWVIDIPLTEPYTIAYETIHLASNVFMAVETDIGITGYGCAAPDLEVTGETSASVMTLLQEKVEPYLHNNDPFQIAKIVADLKANCPHSPSLLAMVDMAIYDLMAKKAGMPLYKMLGGYRKSIPTSITIGIMPVDETVEKAREYVKKGFSILKIKGGSDVNADIERIAAVREKLGRGIVLRFDANQGYSVAETTRFVDEASKYGIEILEQPTPSDAFESLGEVTQKLHLPIMADESLLTLNDVFRLAKNGWADMVNIKLMKVGGITQAMHINSVAKAAGMEAMVGCMDESELGISAGLHFALARPNVEYADLDGHLDLLEDPARGCLILKDGVLYPNGKDGLGLENL